MSSDGYIRVNRDQAGKVISYGWSEDIPPVEDRPLALRDVQRFEVLEVAVAVLLDTHVEEDAIMLAPYGWNGWKSVLHVALEAAAAGKPVLAHTLRWTWEPEDEEADDE